MRLPKSRLATVQVLEYLRAFLVARVGWSRLNALGIISGAFGLFHRPVLEAVGGYWTETVGEDFELTLRLHRYLRERGEPYRIAFISDPVCWTEVPAEFATLGRQRRRWQRGLWQGIRRHAALIGRPRYGLLGVVAMPYFLFFEFLSPVFALLGLVVTTVWFLVGGLSLAYFLAFLTVSIGLGLLLTTAALALEEFSYRRYRRRGEVVAAARLRGARERRLPPAPRRLAGDGLRRHRPRQEGLGRPAAARVRGTGGLGKTATGEVETLEQTAGCLQRARHVRDEVLARLSFVRRGSQRCGRPFATIPGVGFDGHGDPVGCEASWS